MFERLRSNPEAEYYFDPDPETLGMVSYYPPPLTPKQKARRDEIWEFCNAITWRQLRERDAGKRDDA